METYEWINNFDYHRYRTPIKVKSDRDYLTTLTQIYDNLIVDLKLVGADDEIVSIVSFYTKKVLESINLYYQGNILKSQSLINEVIVELQKDKLAVCSINDGIIFLGCSDSNPEVQFFRARLDDCVTEFSADEMLHIPFSKREIVNNNRFSINGLPCLYLGNSSYVCWIEMGRPADYKFNVSPVVLDNSQKIFNLVVSLSDLFKFKKMQEKGTDLSSYRDEIISIMKLSILNICTSFKVQDFGRVFKSEYIISQMIMLSCINLDLDGVAYTSKQVSDELFARVAGINLALFAKYNGEEKHSEICKRIQIGDSFNFSFFKQIKNSLKYKKYLLNVDLTPYVCNIGSFKRQFPYRETEFHDFDEYLFATWDNK